jgi:hypothetical protein
LDGALFVLRFHFHFIAKSIPGCMGEADERSGINLGFHAVRIKLER